MAGLQRTPPSRIVRARSPVPYACPDAKLLDFGLARVRDGTISLIPTAQGTVMGTAGYMAPEQARGKIDDVDARSDLFSVGAVMFKAMTGRRIHEKPTPRLDGQAEAVTTPIGLLPAPGSLDLDGLDVSWADLALLLTVDTQAWKLEAEHIPEFFRTFHRHLPDRLWELHRELAARLEAASSAGQQGYRG